MTIERLNNLLKDLKVNTKSGFARVDKNNYADPNCEDLKNSIIEYMEEVAVQAANSGYDGITGTVQGDVKKALADLSEVAVLLSDGKASEKLTQYRKKVDDCRAQISKRGPKYLSYSLKDEMRTYLTKTQQAVDITIEKPTVNETQKAVLREVSNKLSEVTFKLMDNVIDSSSKEALEMYNKLHTIINKFGDSFAARDYTSTLLKQLDQVDDAIEMWSQCNGGSQINPQDIVKYANDKNFRIRNVIVANQEDERFFNFKNNLAQNLVSYQQTKDELNKKNNMEMEYEALQTELTQMRALYEQGIMKKDQFVSKSQAKIAKFKDLGPRVQKYQQSRLQRLAVVDSKMDLVYQIQDNIQDIEANKDYPVLFARLSKAFPIYELSNLLVGEKTDKEAINVKLAQFRAMANKITEEYMIEAPELFNQALELGNTFHNRFSGIQFEDENQVKAPVSTAEDLLADLDSLGIGGSSTTEDEVPVETETEEVNILDDIDI